MQGQSNAQRWIWNNTIGPLTERPGRLGDWGYINTECLSTHTIPNVGLASDFLYYFSGLGLLEYLLFIEDMGMEPIMAVWAGYSLNGVSIAEADLAPFIQVAKDQVSSSLCWFLIMSDLYNIKIDFVIGDHQTNAMGASFSTPQIRRYHRKRSYRCEAGRFGTPCALHTELCRGEHQQNSQIFGIY